MNQPRKPIIVVDLECSGLDPAHHIPVEAAWADYDTGDYGTFVVPHDVAWVLEHGDPEALRINGYVPRLVHEPHGTAADILAFAKKLHGATLAGANPAFDLRFLPQIFDPYGIAWQPHHRMLDVGNIAVGRLRLDPHNPPSLHETCQLLNVPPGNHSALGDVTATVACLRRLAATVAVHPTIGATP